MITKLTKIAPGVIDIEGIVDTTKSTEEINLDMFKHMASIRLDKNLEKQLFDSANEAGISKEDAKILFDKSLHLYPWGDKKD